MISIVHSVFFLLYFEVKSFFKAKFRVLAYTDSKVDKVGQLQLIVMNLQIDLIRSLSSIKEEVSLAVASPRMYKLYITINEDMRRFGNELLKVSPSIFVNFLGNY